jgi:hypothetical protein
MFLKKILMFFLWPGLRKRTVLLLSPVTLQVVAVAVLMSFSGPSALSFSPSLFHHGLLKLEDGSLGQILCRLPFFFCYFNESSFKNELESIKLSLCGNY